jgi:hypothetical protein
MTYIATEPPERDPLDKIRRLVRDTSNDPLTEFFPDETYTTVIANSVSWRHATIEMAISVAGKIEEDPTSLSSDSDSIAWQQRTRQLYSLVSRMEREIAAEEKLAVESSFGEPVIFEIPYMTESSVPYRRRRNWHV